MKKTALLLLIVLSMINGAFAQYSKVKSQDIDIYYRIFGEGTPLLILGGGPGDNSDRYVSLCELLSPDFQCILVDQRGSGKSVPIVYDSTTISVSLTLNDFEVLREHLELKEWAVLGFSYGGYLASLYADSYSQSISKLILLESAGLNINFFNYFVDNITSRLWAEDMELVNYWSDSLRLANDYHHAITERIRAMMPGYFFDREKALKYRDGIKDSDFSFEMGSLMWGDIIDNDLDLAKKETRFVNPVLILHGRQDPVGESVPQLLSQYYKNSKLIFIERAGHYSWIEQPEKVYSFIKSFFEPKKF